MMRRSAQLAVAVCLFGLGLGVWLVQRKASNSSVRYLPRPKGTLTFNKDIAPIIFKQCSGCHRPGQSAPFSLLTYADAKKRSQEIAEVTAKRIMPPWLPEPGYGEFAEARILSAEELGQVGQWISEGAIEGEGPAPPLPKWSEGWQLGEPDLAVKMAEPYTLAAEGQDVYRNFVIGVPVSETRYVRAIEFQPGNPKIVHHAVMRVDRTPSSRLLDTEDWEPGFANGMGMGNAQLPDGFFIGWTPGKMPSNRGDGLAWRLTPGTDLVLQLHMRPTGKPELIQPVIGLYFSAEPPQLYPYPVVLRSKFIDIEAEQRDYVIEQTETLPIDVLAQSIYPHAHYLAKVMEVRATLADGASQWLLRIRNWDFNWQDEYRFAKPIILPRGTTISMRYTYDNSTNNVRNPNHPPKRVRHGQNSTDEMAELMLQVLPRNLEDLTILRDYSTRRAILQEIVREEEKLKLSPANAEEHVRLGLRYQQISEMESALGHFRRAAQMEPDQARTHYLLGDALAQSGLFDDALNEFQEAGRLKPDQPETLNGLAQIFSSHPDPKTRSPEKAVAFARRASELTKQRDPVILETLAIAYATAGQYEKVIETGEAAVKAALDVKNQGLADAIQKRLDQYKQTRGVP